MNNCQLDKRFSPFEQLKSLFVNRTDCYCIQLKQGYSRLNELLSDKILQKHLSGEVTVGSYQLNEYNCVKWLCFDFDPEKLSDPRATTKKVLSVLLEPNGQGASIGIWKSSIVLEASRYPDPSYHIWVLFAESIKAKAARWLGLRILEIAGLSPKQVEIFPKQDEVTADRPFGNFVKLPFGRHQVEGKWSRMLDLETFEPVPSEEVECKHGLTFSEADLELLERLQNKKNVQVKFEAPIASKRLSSKDEEKTVSFLARYWQSGYRNDLTLSFCGMCIKQGVSHESARRIIGGVCERTSTSAFDTSEFLQKVDYQFTHRANIGSLKGSSGIREVVEAIKEKQNVKVNT